MRFDKLIGERFKEKPSDAVIDSHALMLRGGYIKQVSNGIYSCYPALKRVLAKIESIVRQEMDAIDGQEVLFPVTLPASLWQESGRYETVGNELLRFIDRNGIPMVLGMTHEEAAVHLVSDYAQSYTKYPFMIYQIQTKFRDEARPRGGLIRVREFTMKDGYSFHTSYDDMAMYYERCFKAYERIFTRCGIPEVISVESDSGMMGGRAAHEFILLSPAGEDSIVTCGSCDFKTNMEAAQSVICNQGTDGLKPLVKVFTPGTKTIADVCGFLGIPVVHSCKAVIFQKNAGDEYVAVFIRGDLDINETKLRNFLGQDIHPASITGDSEISAGFTGPLGLKNTEILFDNSLNGINNLCCGANQIDYHFTGFNIERDIGCVEYHDFAKVTEGGICPKCHNKTLSISRGIEVGNIFQLGTKYTEIMNMRYIDENGKPQHPVMGCYGIGIGRLAASVCEARHDENGPIWPLSIAPWQVHLCCLRADDAQTVNFADKLYELLLNENIEVIYDSRHVSAGVMFSDADLLGVPLRVIVSPRNIKDNLCEIVTRDKKTNMKVNSDDVLPEIKKILSDLTAKQ